MTIHLEAAVPATPERVYALLTDISEYSRAVGMAGDGGTAEGESFSLHDGNTTGRHIELVPAERIVQAVRHTGYEPGRWSLLTFTLAPAPGGTCLTLELTGYPPAQHDHLSSGYPLFYLTPVSEYFTSGDYATRIRTKAAPDRVLQALTSVSDLAAWYAPATQPVTGQLTFEFGAGIPPLVIQIAEPPAGAGTRWHVQSSPLPEWAGTTIAFTLHRTSNGQTVIEFRHHGLRRELSCYGVCVPGWEEQYLPSLRDYLDSGTGNPYVIGEKPRIDR